MKLETATRGLVAAVLAAVACGCSIEAGSGGDLDALEQLPPSAESSCSSQAVARLSASGAEAGSPASNVLDGSLATRWAQDGVGSWLQADLGAVQPLCSVGIAWYRGELRTSAFRVLVSDDGGAFRTVFDGRSSGRSAALERYDFANTTGRYVRLVVSGNTEGTWASVTELRVFGGAPSADAGTSTDASAPSDGGAPSDASALHDAGASASHDAGASYTCARTLAPGGSVQAFVDSIGRGETGCLRGGNYTVGDLAFTRPGVTLASYPGERATIQLGYAHIDARAIGVSLRRLNLRTTGRHLIRIFGNNALLELNDITNTNADGAGACVGVGGSNGRPDGVVLRANRFHDCGGTATTLNHAIYAHSYSNLTIVDNVFWRSGGYSIQLYPDAEGTVVRHNVIDGSNEYSRRGGLVIDGDRSDHHVIEYNVFTHTRTEAVVVRVGTGHQVNRNCFWSNSGGDVSGAVPQSGNVTADPRYADRARWDHRLAAGSECLAVVQYDTAARVAAAW